MSKIVISGYYGFNNAGDEALLTAILAALRAKEPKADITVISGNPGNTIAKHQVKSLYRFAAVRLLRAIREADLVISGGGSLLQDVTSKRSLALRRQNGNGRRSCCSPRVSVRSAAGSCGC